MTLNFSCLKLAPGFCQNVNDGDRKIHDISISKYNYNALLNSYMYRIMCYFAHVTFSIRPDV